MEKNLRDTRILKLPLEQAEGGFPVTETNLQFNRRRAAVNHFLASVAGNADASHESFRAICPVHPPKHRGKLLPGRHKNTMPVFCGPVFRTHKKGNRLRHITPPFEVYAIGTPFLKHESNCLYYKWKNKKSEPLQFRLRKTVKFCIGARERI
ncbi:MAG: hypothetical protein AAB634_02675 [Patescibacteria group bacterium]